MPRIVSAIEGSAGGVADLEASSPFAIGAAVVSRGSGAATLGFRSSPAGDLPRPSPSTAAWREAIRAEITVASTVTIVQPKWIRQAFMEIGASCPPIGRRVRLASSTFSATPPGNGELGGALRTFVFKNYRSEEHRV